MSGPLIGSKARVIHLGLGVLGFRFQGRGRRREREREIYLSTNCLRFGFSGLYVLPWVYGFYLRSFVCGFCSSGVQEMWTFRAWGCQGSKYFGLRVSGWGIIGLLYRYVEKN